MPSSRDPVAALRSLAVPLAPSSGTPPIRGVPNIGRSAPSKHKTETTGMSAPVIAKVIAKALEKVGFDKVVERGIKKALAKSSMDASNIMAS